MSEAPPDLKQSDVIYKGRVFKITVDHVAYPDGRVVKMECVRHRGSVVLLPMTASGGFSSSANIAMSLTSGCGSCRPGRSSRMKPRMRPPFVNVMKR